MDFSVYNVYIRTIIINLSFLIIAKEENLNRAPSPIEETIKMCKLKGVMEGKWNKLKVGGGPNVSNVVVRLQLLNYVILDQENYNNLITLMCLDV